MPLVRYIISMRYLWLAALLLCAVTEAADTQSAFRIEKTQVQGGAELITVYQVRPGATELPVVAMLRDTMGDSDPANDRLRNVWILTYKRPSIAQRLASAVPFFYFRMGSQDPPKHERPVSLLDMQAPRRSSWGGIVATAMQAQIFDPLGRIIRTSTRSYRLNGSEYRRMRIAEAIAALSKVQPSAVLPEDERERVEARLDLSGRLLGGFVSEKRLPYYYQRTAVQIAESRAHNWELLRQQAEDNGLYFQPLSLNGNGPAQALLWLAREEVPANENRRFDSGFLGISAPWKDPRLANWKHYEESWYFDSDGRRIAYSTKAVRSLTMVPLALYSLDHPRVPLLLADFRAQRAPSRREMLRRASSDVTTGLLGITKLGSWEFMAVSSAWDFYTGRHGAANDRASRVRAFAQLRYSLELDTEISPDLRNELIHQVDRLSLNPLDSASNREQKIALKQYSALLEWAQSPDGLGREIVQARASEGRRVIHSGGERAWLTTASVFSLGLYRHHETPTPELISEISRRRKIQTHTRFLEEVLASGPKLEVAWNMDDVQRSLKALSELAGNDAHEQSLVQALLTRILAQTHDSQAREIVLDSVRTHEAVPSGTE